MWTLFAFDFKIPSYQTQLDLQFEIPIFSDHHLKTFLFVFVQYRYEHEHAHSVSTGYCTFIQEQFVPTSGPRQYQRSNVIRIESLG